MNASTLEDLAVHFQSQLNNVRTVLDLRPRNASQNNVQTHVNSLEQEVEHLELVMSRMKIEKDRLLAKLKQTEVIKTINFI